MKTINRTAEHTAWEKRLGIKANLNSQTLQAMKVPETQLQAKLAVNIVAAAIQNGDFVPLRLKKKDMIPKPIFRARVRVSTCPNRCRAAAWAWLPYPSKP